MYIPKENIVDWNLSMRNIIEISDTVSGLTKLIFLVVSVNVFSLALPRTKRRHSHSIARNHQGSGGFSKVIDVKLSKCTRSRFCKLLFQKGWTG